MDFLFPRLPPFCLILLSCHLSTLRSHQLVGPSTSPFVLCLKPWFCFNKWSPVGEGFLVCWFSCPLPMSECFDCRSYFMTDIFFLFVPWSSSIHVESAMSSFHKVIGVHHVPCFIFDLNSSRDLPKLNWEFLTGVNPTKYPISTKAYYWLKNQPRHHG